MASKISENQFQEKEKEADIRGSNMLAAKAVADMVRTSLGPRGMDKMIARPSGEVLITNDGATIMSELKLLHPAAQMMVELSKAQDVEAGDGTTSVVVTAGALLGCCKDLFAKGIHPNVVARGFKKAAAKSMEILQDVAIPVELSNRESLIQAASTSLNSKVVSQNAALLAPLAVDSVLQVIDPATATNVELKDIRITKKLGGTIDDTKLVKGLIFAQGAVHRANGPARVENAKIGLIQFCLSSPKSNMDNQVVLNDYTKMDRFINEERRYLLKLVRAIKKTGCNVLLIQKSILRDAVNDISLKFLAEMKIMVVKDIERTDIEFISKTIGCTPAASIETFTKEKLGSAELVEEEGTAGGKVVLVTGVPASKTVSVLCRGSNKLVLDECERSVHDALCVVRSLVKSKYMIAGGGAPEIELSLQLTQYAKTVEGLETHCIRAFADALEIIPYTLAENAGLRPISIVTELRNRHVSGEKRAGINVRKGTITNILEEDVLQPLLVTQSCIQLATETVCMILKIDDIVSTR
mmetsp:Transcript_13083/g.52186  ORF Transcript_13083/g.52186 Transcript_13083/m.52186 type:complete len:526 (+) Transcript_13083:147-1724(+)